MATEPGQVIVLPKALLRLQVPLALAVGKYEQLTDEELEDHFNDIQHERTRRNAERV